jgi:hypothetical protein
LPASFAVKDPKTSRTISSAMTSVTSRSNASTITKKNFDRDDVEKLNQYLEESLMPNDACSRLSRNSKSGRGTTAYSVSSAKSLASIHEKPFK